MIFVLMLFPQSRNAISNTLEYTTHIQYNDDSTINASFSKVAFLALISVDRTLKTELQKIETRGYKLLAVKNVHNPKYDRFSFHENNPMIGDGGKIFFMTLNDSDPALSIKRLRFYLKLDKPITKSDRLEWARIKVRINPFNWACCPEANDDVYEKISKNSRTVVKLNQLLDSELGCIWYGDWTVESERIYTEQHHWQGMAGYPYHKDLILFKNTTLEEINKFLSIS